MACQARKTSATLQAWAMQPPGAWGGSPSKTSLTVPAAGLGEEVVPQGGHQGPRGRAVAVGQQVGVHQGAQQPGPDGAPVVGAVPAGGSPA